MTHYIGVLEKEPGTLWGVWFPDLVGCTTAAETADLALEQAPDALRLWLECAAEDGEEPPAARTLEALRKDPEVVEAITAGHALVVVTLGEEALFDQSALTAIDAAAGRQGVSRQRFIHQTLLEKVVG